MVVPLGNDASLSLAPNGKGLIVEGAQGSSLWVELDVLYANDIMPAIWFW